MKFPAKVPQYAGGASSGLVPQSCLIRPFLPENRQKYLRDLVKKSSKWRSGCTRLIFRSIIGSFGTTKRQGRVLHLVEGCYISPLERNLGSWVKVRKLTENQARHDKIWEKFWAKKQKAIKRGEVLSWSSSSGLFAHRPSKILSFSDLPSSLVRLATERPPHHFSAMQSVRVSTQTSPCAVSGLKRFDRKSMLEILEILKDGIQGVKLSATDCLPFLNDHQAAKIGILDFRFLLAVFFFNFSVILFFFFRTTLLKILQSTQTLLNQPGFSDSIIFSFVQDQLIGCFQVHH